MKPADHRRRDWLGLHRRSLHLHVIVPSWRQSVNPTRRRLMKSIPTTAICIRLARHPRMLNEAPSTSAMRATAASTGQDADQQCPPGQWLHAAHGGSSFRDPPDIICKGGPPIRHVFLFIGQPGDDLCEKIGRFDAGGANYAATPAILPPAQS
jgi:hypothetical protein